MTKWRIDSKVGMAVCGTKNGRLCLPESAVIIWMASRQQTFCQEERPSSSALKKTSSCPSQMLAWVHVIVCGFWSWKGKMSSVPEVYHQTVSHPHTGWPSFTKRPVVWGGHGLMQRRRRPEGPCQGQRQWIRQQLGQPQRLGSSLQAPS